MIYVCNLHEMPAHVAALGPTHLISLVAPGELPTTPAGIELERHLRIEVHDISEPLDGRGPDRAGGQGRRPRARSCAAAAQGSTARLAQHPDHRARRRDAGRRWA